MKFVFSVMLSCCLVVAGFGQQSYQYKVDLTKASGNAVQVVLLTPRISKPAINFFMPAIVPGTYKMSNFGRFVSNLKAYDKKGQELPVVHEKYSNSWKISKASSLYRITYTLEDTWHQNFDTGVYPMGGTSIEPGKSFVINGFGFFGYFENMEKLPFEVQFQKPKGFYASSALAAVSTTDNTDVFQVESVHELYDSPIMYCEPDTASVNLGRTKVLVSVYSPGRKVRATTLAKEMEQLLTATQSYLGGKLPIKKYAFLYNFSNRSPMAGALEHNYSSFYALGDLPESEARKMIVSISAHEFFHILTPLSISSKEIKEFNYQQPVLSKHLWLYEGSTEYDAHHLQVKYGLIDEKQFFKVLAEKINNSRSAYIDTLPFTTMSKEVATTYEKQYGNVYEKGALISACLDICLLHLSGGKYGLNNLKHDLGIKFGRDKYFNDDSLFDDIAALSFPEVKDFLNKYVAGNTPLPYTQIFALAGVNYRAYFEREVFSIGQPGIAVMSGNKAKVVGVQNLDEVGKNLGYQLMDEVVSLNGQPVKGKNFTEVLEKIRPALKQGDMLTVVVKRRNEAGVEEEKTLSAPVSAKEKLIELNQISLMDDGELSPLQRAVRNAWLEKGCN